MRELVVDHLGVVLVELLLFLTVRLQELLEVLTLAEAAEVVLVMQQAKLAALE